MFLHKSLLKIMALVGLSLCSLNSHAGWTDQVKQDASKAWHATKQLGHKVGEDVSNAYHHAKNTSSSSLYDDAKKQGLRPIKPKEDQAGIPQ